MKHLPDFTSYIVAFKGPASMATVARWIPKTVKKLAAPAAELVDMVVVLGKGVLWRIDAHPAIRIPNPQGHEWAYVDQETGNVVTLFAHMLTWVGTENPQPYPLKYLESFHYDDIKTV